MADQDESGRDRSEVFHELPDREALPDYYQVITQPISLQEIKVRLLNCCFVQH